MKDYPDIIMILEPRQNDNYILSVYKRTDSCCKLLKVFFSAKAINKNVLRKENINNKKDIITLRTKIINNKEYIRVLKAKALIGRNGITNDKREGDGMTPAGIYGFGIAFGTRKRENIKISKEIEYIKINDNLYWVDDVNSRYYNTLVEIKSNKDLQKVEIKSYKNWQSVEIKPHRDWQSAEHLSDYPIEYKYAIEIKANPNNINGKGSAIFLHCSNGKPTSGCIAISKRKMKKVFKIVRNDTLIIIGYDKYVFTK